MGNITIKDIRNAFSESKKSFEKFKEATTLSEALFVIESIYLMAEQLTKEPEEQICESNKETYTINHLVVWNSTIKRFNFLSTCWNEDDAKRVLHWTIISKHNTKEEAELTANNLNKHNQPNIDRVNILIEDYENKIIAVSNILNEDKPNGSMDCEKRRQRLLTKQSEYRAFISELNKINDQ